MEHEVNLGASLIILHTGDKSEPNPVSMNEDHESRQNLDGNRMVFSGVRGSA